MNWVSMQVTVDRSKFLACEDHQRLHSYGETTADALRRWELVKGTVVRVHLPPVRSLLGWKCSSDFFWHILPEDVARLNADRAGDTDCWLCEHYVDVD
jgi:hypothetical protein